MKALKIRIFSHSLVSDWNHGNAHFLRGLARALVRMGHNVRCFEQLGSWSLSNLVRHEGESAIASIDQFRQTYPELDIHFYNDDATFTATMEHELRHADVVIIHEWNEPRIVNQILALKQKHKFLALFHDTHHRAYTRAGEMLRFNLNLFDGVLAFGEAIRKIYAEGFGIRNVWTFHEAADVDTFTPAPLPKQNDVLWIGNWGDDERPRELEEFLIRPAEELKVRTIVHGVRYPDAALRRFADAGIEYRGYLPNLEAPRVYSESLLSLHVPRRQYSNGLSGIPTIRVFEALACGAPLVCAPWSDEEKLFRSGEDYLIVNSGEEMRDTIARLLRDPQERRQIAANGLATVRARHTCRHRAEHLVEIVGELRA